MKIYNKKKFTSGIFMLGLAVLLVVLTIIQAPFGVTDFILDGFLIGMGIFCIVRSTNKRYTSEDLIEENDERNKFIELKSHNKTLQFSRIAMFLLGFSFIIYGAIIDEMILTAVGVTFSFCWTITYICDFITFLYYYKKMTEGE